MHFNSLDTIFCILKNELYKMDKNVLMNNFEGISGTWVAAGYS